MRRLLFVGALLATVAGCAGKQPFADDQTIASVSYRDAGSASLTLYTMVNNRSGEGGHSALLINASQRVIFDPAGSFYADIVPERNDVLFGITPAVEKAYRSAHARSTFHVVSQTLTVSAEQAEAAYRMALGNGAVPGAFCANATSRILSRIPGLESIKPTFYPVKLQRQMEQLPGVVTEKYYEGDSPDLKEALKRGNAALTE